MSDVTLILQQIEDGDPSAAEQLLPLVYDELRKLAAARMAQERPDHTLQPTALIHEAYLRLVDGSSSGRWQSRAHFLAAAAEAMRRVLVDEARRRSSLKRGGDHRRIDFNEAHFVAPEISDRLLAIDESLRKLAATDPQAAQLVQLKYFGGMTLREAAAHLGIPPRTADEVWAYSRAWLFRELTRQSA